MPPPRLQPHRLPQPSSCQWPRQRPQVVPDLQIPSRSFHTTPAALKGNLSKDKLRPTKSTLLRREMAEWLNGPGYKFRRPFPGSTNYLSAYDKNGNLKRKRDDRAAQRPSPSDEAAEEATILKQEEEDGIDEAERAARAEGRAAARLQRAAESRVPREKPSDMHPYPLNQNFRSQPVLSEEMREELYRMVVLRKMDLQGVSAAYGVDMRRVAAVVRLKTIEKQWIEDGTTLAKPYNDAVLAMLPTTPLRSGAAGAASAPHESINDLPVHPATRQQLFYPTSESRQFTREDAAKAFSSKLLPAEKRIPHPQLVQLERWNVEEVSRPERLQRFAELEDKEMAIADEKARKQKEWAERTQRTVEGRRWDFKFQDISSEAVGKHGRSSKGVGYRYGMPHTDRKRGEVKIPTSVE